MVRVSSLFRQLLSHVPRLEFAGLMAKHKAEYGAKGFSCWSQFVAVLFGQLAHADSLREISNSLTCCLGKLRYQGLAKAPPRSTLAYANAPWDTESIVTTPELKGYGHTGISIAANPPSRYTNDPFSTVAFRLVKGVKFMLQTRNVKRGVSHCGARVAGPILAAWLLGLTALLAGACASTAVRPDDGTVPSELAFSAEERALLDSGPADTPMKVRLNDAEPGASSLRQPSRDVLAYDPAVALLEQRMMATVLLEKGVGIAAPQVGINRRAIWVLREDLPTENKWRFYANPRIVKQSHEEVTDWEGCLSIPAGFAKVRRSHWVEITYNDKDGSLHQEHVDGFPARIFQHEIDHLDGVLFIDRMEEGTLIDKESYRAMRAKEKEQTSASPQAAEAVTP